MLSLVVCGRPICLPLALAFAIPDRTRSLIIASSSWLNTPAICKKASLIGSALPSRQSSVIDPTITSRKRFSRTVSIIAQSCWVLLARRETSKTMMVADGRPGEAIAAFGDAITAMNLWVPDLRRRIQETADAVALLNLGISGNRLLRDTSFAKQPGHGQLFGRSGLKRLEWDVLEAPGVSTMLLALGGNDIAQPGGNPASSPPAAERCTEKEFIEGCREVIRRCHEKEIRVIGCTITPFGGYLTADAEAMKIRREINRWIQQSGEFDGVVDFAGAIAAPGNPDFMLAALDSGDHLHPSAAGGNAMAECVDLNMLLRSWDKGAGNQFSKAAGGDPDLPCPEAAAGI